MCVCVGGGGGGGYCVLLENLLMIGLVLPSTGHENNIAKPKKINVLALRLVFHRFSPFNCCLRVVL